MVAAQQSPFGGLASVWGLILPSREWFNGLSLSEETLWWKEWSLAKNLGGICIREEEWESGGREKQCKRGKKREKEEEEEEEEKQEKEKIRASSVEKKHK